MRSDVDPESQTYIKALEKALKQKMFVLSRTRSTDEHRHANSHDCPLETLEIAGSKGNVYNITISHLTTCDCPVGIFIRKGAAAQCKHVLYALHQVFRIDDLPHLRHRQSFLTSELQTLFAHAPPLPSQIGAESKKDGNRKAADGECPICFVDFAPADTLVWCQASCGNNLHAACFRKWEISKHPHVTCPFCRAEWKKEDEGGGAKVQQSATFAEVRKVVRDGGGYYNVADQLEY